MPTSITIHFDAHLNPSLSIAAAFDGNKATSVIQGGMGTVVNDSRKATSRK
jgi:hypothetical protein